jgi:hypothetical protein
MSSFALLHPAHINALTDSARTMGEEITRNTRGQALVVEDLCIFARSKNWVHLMTIHKAIQSGGKPPHSIA